MIHQIQQICSVCKYFQLANRNLQSMAPSALSDMKMKSLLFGVILGLFAVVHSTPVNTVSQIPAKVEDDVLREAIMDEFLVDQLFFPSLTTEPPKRNTTVQASHQPTSDMEETNDKSTNSVLFQDRGEHYATTTPSSTSTVLPSDIDDSTSDSSTTQSPQSDFTSSMSSVARSSVTPDHSFMSTLSFDLGSGDGEILSQSPATSSSMTSSSNTETSSTSSTSTATTVRLNVPRMFAESNESGSGLELESKSRSESESGSELGSESESESGSELGSESESESELGSGFTDPTTTSNTETSTASSTSTAAIVGHNAPRVFAGVHDPKKGVSGSPQHQGHSTPDWIIILGFVVGVAVLVIICAAIATRDKWNRSNQLETKTNSSHQQRGVEMETFLHKEVPRENGKEAEYTVISLDELPEKYSQ